MLANILFRPFLSPFVPSLNWKSFLCIKYNDQISLFSHFFNRRHFHQNIQHNSRLHFHRLFVNHFYLNSDLNEAHSCTNISLFSENFYVTDKRKLCSSILLILVGVTFFLKFCIFSFKWSFFFLSFFELFSVSFSDQILGPDSDFQLIFLLLPVLFFNKTDSTQSIYSQINFICS